MTDDTIKPAIESWTPPAVTRYGNRPMNAMLGIGQLRKRLGDSIVTIEFNGRKSGKQYQLPVGQRELLGKRSVFSKQSWALNFRGGADARIRLSDGWHKARGTLVEDVETIARAYAEGIEQVGWQKTKTTLGLIINVGRVPTLDELKDYVTRTGYSVIQFDLT
jgi:hypothetical protein